MDSQANALAVSEAAKNTIFDMLAPGLNKLPYAEIDLKHSPDVGRSRIDVWCREDKDRDVRTKVLVLHFLHDCRQMHIPNIMMPETMKHERLGKRTLKALFDVAEEHGYELFVVDMVQSFYDRLIKRGAWPVDEESVQITSTTDLVGDVGSPKLTAETEVQSVSLFDLLKGL